ncbi:hypothetical protein ACO0KY_10715 [Undibacterium sp. Dicai25W]|uniref:hypothetical protein n=1 Tax=Undibacterium sp. Dicai25W TaxID=3413034 RepID=UPI003BF1EA39
MFKEWLKWFVSIWFYLYAVIILVAGVGLTIETINTVHAPDLVQRWEMVAGSLTLGFVLWILAKKLKRSSKFKPNWQNLFTMLGSVRVFWFIRF